MEIAAWANRCYIITPHQKRRFPERVDFHTSAGFLDGQGEREAAGVRGRGPQAVVTDLGILEPDEDGELVLAALHPGVSVEAACENTGWPLQGLPQTCASPSRPPRKSCASCAKSSIRRAST